MKRTTTRASFCIAALAVLSLAANGRAAIIADWTFDTSKPSSAGPIAPEIGSGTGTAFHASSSTVYSAPAGNGSLNSWSTNSWQVGDYYQFVADASGFTGVTIEWDQTGSGTGPRDFVLQYSSDGTNFTTFGSQYSLFSPAVSWSSGTYNSSNHLTALVNDLDGAATAYFRIRDNSTTAFTGSNVLASGSNRVDNVVIQGSPVPEPATVLLGAIGFGLIVLGSRRIGRLRKK